MGLVFSVSAITSHFQSGGKDDYSKDPEVIKQLGNDTSVDAEVRKRLTKLHFLEFQTRFLCFRYGHIIHGTRSLKM